MDGYDNVAVLMPKGTASERSATAIVFDAGSSRVPAYLRTQIMRLQRKSGLAGRTAEIRIWTQCPQGAERYERSIG